MSDLTDTALHELTPHLAPIDDSMGAVRAILDTLVAQVQQATLAELRSAADAARAWNVTERRARAYIATLHERYGIGLFINGSWLLLQHDVELFPPAQKYRPEKYDEAAMSPLNDAPDDPANLRAGQAAGPAQGGAISTQHVTDALQAANLPLAPRTPRNHISGTSPGGYSATPLPNGTVRVDYEPSAAQYNLDFPAYQAVCDAALVVAQATLQARNIPCRVVPSGTGAFIVAGMPPAAPSHTTSQGEERTAL